MKFTAPRSYVFKALSLFLIVSHFFTYSAFADESITVQNGSVNDWANFNVGEGQNTSITVVDELGNPMADGRAIINVLQDYATQIGGNLDIFGIIAILNANGFNIGADANVNVVGGLILSSLGVNQEQFFAGMTALAQDPSMAPGFINNQGNFNIDPNSFLALIAGAIKNTGNIVTEGGTAILAAGKEGELMIGGDGLVSVKITKAVDAEVYDFQGNKVADQIDNSGTIAADGGLVKLTAKGSEEIFDNIINHSGIIRATSIAEKDGQIILEGGEEGVVRVTGTLDASGKDAGEKGGTVHVLGYKVGLFDHASVDVSGDAGGGAALIGGDYKGSNPFIQNADYTYVGPDASINASAINSGNGSKIIVWGTESSKAYGSLVATGGALSGDGGFIETSGHYLDTAGIRVSTAAVNGKNGQWLLDPYNITISTNATSNGAFAGGAFNPSGNASVLNITDLIAALAGTSITITTDGVGVEAGNITVTHALTYNGDNKLTLDADNNVALNAAITLGGDFEIIAGNNVTQTAALSVEGTTTVNAGGNITLTHADNDFGGVQNIFLEAGGSISLVDSNEVLNVGRAVAEGNIELTAPTISLINATVTGDAVTLNTTKEDVAAGNNAIIINQSIITAEDLNMNTASGRIYEFFRGLRVSNALTINAADGNDDDGNNVSLFEGIDPTGDPVNYNTFGTIEIQDAHDVQITGNGQFTVYDVNATGNIQFTAQDMPEGDDGSISIAGTIAGAEGKSVFFHNDGSGGIGLGIGTVVSTNGAELRLRALGEGDIVDHVSGSITTTNGGTLNISTEGAIDLNGTVTASGTTTFDAEGNITVDNAANNFGTVTVTDGANVALADVDALTLEASTFSGNYTATAGGAITVNGAVASTGGGSIQISSNGSATTNDLTVNANVSTTGGNGNVTITAGDTVTIADGVTVSTAGTGAIRVSSGEDYSDSTFDNDGNSGGDVIMNGSSSLITRDGDITVTSRDGISLRTVNSDFDSDAGGGNIQITGGNSTTTFNSAVTSGGTTTITNGALALIANGASITSAGAFTQSGGGTFTSFGNIVTSDADISIHNLNMGGDLMLSTGAGGGGNISVSSSISGGTRTLTLLAGTGNITATSASNNISTFAVTSANNVNFRDSNALILGASSIGGTLDITTNGALTQSGALSVTGATTLVAGAGNNITLNNASNNFSTVGITSANDVTLRDANALILGASIISGDFSVTTGGALTQSGALTVSGESTFNSGANAITLTNASNDFNNELVTLTGTEVSLTDNDTDGLVLGDVSASSLALVATGDITQGGTGVVVSGTTTLEASGNDIALTEMGNDFGTVAITSAVNADIRDTNAIVLGESTVDTNLIITAGGEITQSGALSIGDSLIVAADGNDITLDNAGNDAVIFQATSGNDVTYVDATDISLDTTTITGSLNVTALDGPIFGDGTITAGDDSVLSTTDYIGMLAAPLDVNITGTLSVTAEGQRDGNSAVMTGIADSIITVGSHMGLILFNGVDVNYVAPPPSSGPTTTEIGEEIAKSMDFSDPSDSSNSNEENSYVNQVYFAGGGTGDFSLGSDLIDTSALEVATELDEQSLTGGPVTA